MASDPRLTMPPRLRVRKQRVIGELDITTLEQSQLVYFLLANRPQNYASGRSRIIYIGSTKNGIDRIAASLAVRIGQVSGEWGIRSVEVRTVTCGRRQKVKTWHQLERAFLLQFIELYGERPRLNGTGQRMKELQEFERYFSREVIDRRLREMEG